MKRNDISRKWEMILLCSSNVNNDGRNIVVLMWLLKESLNGENVSSNESGNVSINVNSINGENTISNSNEKEKVRKKKETSNQ